MSAAGSGSAGRDAGRRQLLEYIHSEAGLREALRYTLRLAELYEEYIMEKGVRYLMEADRYIDLHKGPGYPLL